MSKGYYHTKDSVQEYIRLAQGVNGQELIEKLKPFLPADSSLLEIGSGPGADWKILKEEYDVVGSDNSLEFLEHLRATLPNSEFLHLDAVTLETEKKFDGIFSNKVLHHLTDKELAESVQRQSETLKNKGIVCHSFWSGEDSETFKGMFVNHHTPEEIRLFFGPHFDIL